MTYTPRRLNALINIANRLDAQSKAEAIEAVGAANGPKANEVVRRLREVL